MSREPDFQNVLKILRREKPDRPTLFEFFLNGPLYEKLAGEAVCARDDDLRDWRIVIHAFKNAGYDYAIVPAWYLKTLAFPSGEHASKSSYSINEGGVIHDRESFETYAWQDPAAGDWSVLERLEAELPAGMKMILSSPGGILENTIGLVGYEDLCFLIADEPELVQEIFDAVGSRLEAYYRIGAAYGIIGAAIVNDDWGFKTQTMLKPEDMRRYVFPWHKKMVAALHEQGKPAVLHSCGYFGDVIDDIIEDMEYDGRHSYEDAIIPVEEAYDRYHDRLAILGGIDLDYICRSTPEAVYRRSKAMLERSADGGAYGLGTGNSVPEYVPDENYFAMTRAALEG